MDLVIPQCLAGEVAVAPLHGFMEMGGDTGIWALRTGDLSLDMLGITPSFHRQMDCVWEMSFRITTVFSVSTTRLSLPVAWSLFGKSLSGHTEMK